jgi:hypothetical protein
MATPALDRAELLQAIRKLPPHEQQELALEILGSAELSAHQEPRSSPDSYSLAGLLATGETPPTDQDVAEWLDEHRRAKYGQ